jgi:hypothetical protein
VEVVEPAVVMATLEHLDLEFPYYPEETDLDEGHQAM